MTESCLCAKGLRHLPEAASRLAEEESRTNSLQARSGNYHCGFFKDLNSLQQVVVVKWFCCRRGVLGFLAAFLYGLLIILVPLDYLQRTSYMSE